MIYFRTATSKLGPAYRDCNEKQTDCTRRDAQPFKGCPNCEYTIRYKRFIEELDEELRKLKRGTRKGARRWPRKILLQQVTEAATIASSREGNDPNWTVVTEQLVAIYRSEDAKKRAIDMYIPPTDTNPQGPMLKD